MLGFCPAKMLLHNYFAGAGAGAAGAGAPAAPGAPGAPGAGVAAGASTFGASAGFCSSFLQATTARDKEAKKSTLTKMANIFFIKSYPPFTDFHNLLGILLPNFRSPRIRFFFVLSRQI